MTIPPLNGSPAPTSPANRRRGEVVAIIDGQRVHMRLTLGALAELETAFGVEDMSGLAGRFSRGALSARDLQAIVAVAMRGAGHDVSEADAGRFGVAGELPGIATAVADLLALTFGVAAPAPETAAQANATASTESAGARPFTAWLQRWRSHFRGIR